jgi:sulfite exporter TauE/SafE
MIESLTPIAALVAGFLGSSHCVLMCGGIAGALGLGEPAGGACTGRSLRYPVLYNLGRVASYTAAGGIAGALGGGAIALAGLPRLHTAFAVLAAALIVFVGLRLASGARHFGWLDRAGAAAWRRIAPLTRPLLPVTTPVRAFAVGLVWGWLPCGMAYAMLSAAWLTGGAREGATLMAMFGIGTLPAMLALSAGAASLLGPATRRVGGAALVALGLASGAAQLWPGAAAHAQHAGHEQLGGAAVGAAPVRGFAGQFPELRGIEDPDRLALHLDHAELGQAREQAAHRLDREAEVVGKVAARHRQHE